MPDRKKSSNEAALISKEYMMVVDHGEEGILQNEVWKKLELTSRDGSRLSIRLEKRGMVKREKVLEKGRWTYRLTPERLPANIASIENIPCINCPYESRCEVGGIVTPNNCLLIEKWLTQEHETKDNGEKDTFDYDYSLIKVEQ